MAENLGIISAIEEVREAVIAPYQDAPSSVRLGLGEMIGTMFGQDRSMDGYRVTTDEHVIHVLISNYQNCCEDWGYMTSDDDLTGYVGARLKRIHLTDTALNKQVVEDTAPYGFDEGGIQFVDLVTNRGTLQLAVYNGHNGYYGHSILIVKGDDVLLSGVL